MMDQIYPPVVCFSKTAIGLFAIASTSAGIILVADSGSLRQ